MSETARPPSHPSDNIFDKNIKYNVVKPTLYFGSITILPTPVKKESNHGNITKMSIDKSIAAAPAALLGKAFNIA